MLVPRQQPEAELEAPVRAETIEPDAAETTMMADKTALLAHPDNDSIIWPMEDSTQKSFLEGLKLPDIHAAPQETKIGISQKKSKNKKNRKTAPAPSPDQDQKLDTQTNESKKSKVSKNSSPS